MTNAVRNTTPWPCLIAAGNVVVAGGFLLLQSDCIVDAARRVHIDELERAHHDHRTGATECFDTRFDAQSADAKVTIDMSLNYSEQRAHFNVPGQKEPRLCKSFFVDFGRASFAEVF